MLVCNTCKISDLSYKYKLNYVIMLVIQSIKCILKDRAQISFNIENQNRFLVFVLGPIIGLMAMQILVTRQIIGVK